MCGILGKIEKNSKVSIDEAQFTEALNLQYHRGPDDFGILRGDHFIFGHRRLSIIDLSEHAKQPMTTADQLVSIVFNGEIYNYQEIKKNLVRKGYLFDTDGDTEVILNSYLDQGIDCIQQFIGMFAFSIYDHRNGDTYIVRDRLGIKPLYFYRDETSITFSSEIKSILYLHPNASQLNESAISSYLSFRYPILNDSFFIGIDSLQPGHYLKIGRGGDEKEVQYWNLVECFAQQADDKGEDYYLNKLEELLRSSVCYRMISDVPIGAFLSGGVDSSVITAIMAKESKSPINTFTIGFEDDGYNEFEYAELISDSFSTDHRKITLSGSDYLATLEQLIQYKDAPLSVPNEVPLFLMSQELKKHVTVVLSGEGADEIFGGYGRIFRSPFDYQRMISLADSDLTSEEKSTFIRNFIKKYKTDSFDSEIEHFISIYSYASLDEKKKLLHSDFSHESIEKDLRKKIQSYFDEIKGESYENKMMYVFEKIHLVGLLQRVDASTMAASVEARVPFVDHRLVEFAFTVPLHYKLKWQSNEKKYAARLLMSDEISEKNDIPKYLLKKAYEDVIPDEILYRKKMGFPVPLNNWFGGAFNDYAQKVLLSKKAKSRKLYNIGNIEKWLSDPSLIDNHSMALKIWMLINIEIFCQKYIN